MFRGNQIDLKISVFLENSPIWVQVEHKSSMRHGSSLTFGETMGSPTYMNWVVCLPGGGKGLGRATLLKSMMVSFLRTVYILSDIAHRLNRELTTRMTRGPRPTTASRLLLSMFGPSAFMLPSGGTAARHRKASQLNDYCYLSLDTKWGFAFDL
ncbi:hypothetical protein CSKR_110043 [Clonorchis sinensis]|uniref:Uncharacterized protein n=1 Tax=Clonorchis sinensis TaxID=79923 RepID=A0A419Q317_CLOSI|nr:hypothetical protein CSKR_110043 [Clonorchis sinensis]